MAKHENRVYMVDVHNGRRLVIAHTPAQAREHVIKSYVGDVRRATAMEVASAASEGLEIETIPAEGGAVESSSRG